MLINLCLIQLIRRLRTDNGDEKKNIQNLVTQLLKSSKCIVWLLCSDQSPSFAFSANKEVGEQEAEEAGHWQSMEMAAGFIGNRSRHGSEKIGHKGRGGVNPS